MTDEKPDDISIWRFLLLLCYVIIFFSLIGLSVVMSWPESVAVVILMGGGIGSLLLILFVADRYTTH